MPELSLEGAEGKLITRWKFNPVLFVKECIEAKPSNQQVLFLNTVGEMAQARIKSSQRLPLSRRELTLSKRMGISIKSGHGTGKDCCLAWVYLWLLTCFPFAKGLVTAPTSHQLRDVLWSEINKWIKKSPVLNDTIEWQSERIFVRGHKEGWFVTARTANVKGTEEQQGEALAGLHADYMIMACDESSGIPRGVFTPLEGALTGIMNFAILISNPTRSSGYFFDSQTTDKDRWECFTWNSEDSSIVSRDYIERMKAKYGSDSNMYRIRVLGEFPLSDSHTLIPYEWVQRAVEEYGGQEDLPEKNFVLRGFDIGGGGDKTVMVERSGNRVTDIQEYDSSDTMKVTGWIMKELADDDYNMAFIDPIGIGAGVYDRLMELGVRNLYPVDVRQSSGDSSCAMLRDEIFWRLRKQFENGTLTIPDDEELIGELTTIQYDLKDSTGKIKIESKRDIRKRGLASPNKADALALTYFFGDSTYKSLGKGLGGKKPYKAINWRVA